MHRLSSERFTKWPKATLPERYFSLASLTPNRSSFCNFNFPALLLLPGQGRSVPHATISAIAVGTPAPVCPEEWQLSPKSDLGRCGLRCEMAERTVATLCSSSASWAPEMGWGQTALGASHGPTAYQLFPLALSCEVTRFSFIFHKRITIFLV